MDFGFVGAGGIAQKHLSNLEEMADVDVVAICDVNPETAEQVAASHDAVSYTDHEAMYDESKPDAVFVTTPPFVRGPAERAAADRGIHLFVEKPVALSAEEARETLAAIETAGIVAQVGYVFRYLETVERVRELVDPSDLSLLEGRYAYPGAPEIGWWPERGKSGGQVVEQSTHVYDLVRYLGGDVETVRGVGAQQHVTDMDFPDTTVGSHRHESGAISHVSSTIASAEREASLRLVGPEVALTIDLLSGDLTGTVDGDTIEFSPERDPFVREVEAFADAVATENPEAVTASYEEAVETLEFTLAVTDAADVA